LEQNVNLQIHTALLAAPPVFTQPSIREMVAASSLVQLLSLQCSLDGMGIQA
jgi:hypothetical protein